MNKLFYCFFNVILFASTTFSASVEIVRDTFGVPHIIGDTPRECAYGMAIAQCQDHAKNVVDIILLAGGEMARFYGANFVSSDEKYRMFRIRQEAERHLQEAPKIVSDYLEGFAAGVNYYFNRFPEKLPNEVDAAGFLPVTAVDCNAVGYVYAFAQEWERFRKDAGDLFRLSDVEPRGQNSTMSNQWTVAPWRTRDGAGYLLCDPHLSFNGISDAWEAHLISRDGLLDFEGGFFRGMATPAMGHNRHLAWSHTSNTPDFADAYIVQLDPDAADHYLIDGESRPFRVEKDTIEIAGADDKIIAIRSSTEHGVWSSQIDDHHALFAKLEMQGKPPLTEQGLYMMMANSVAEFDAAMSKQNYYKWNTVVQDDHGDMLYIYNGRVHWRNDADAARNGPLDGSTSTTLWGEQIPFAKLPRIENPASGYLQNCNDAPWYVTDEPGFDKNDVPIELYRGDHFGERGKRATELLQLGGDTLDLDYLKKTALDIKISAWDSVRSVLPLALQESAARGYNRQAFAESLAQSLFNWHGNAAKDSPEMTLFYAWSEFVPDALNFYKARAMNENERETLVSGLVTAGDFINTRYDSLNVPWGDVHGYERNGVWYPLSGGMGKLPTARLGRGNYDEASGRIHVVSGNIFMMLIRIKAGESPKAWTMKPHGQSMDPASPHFADLAALYSADSLRQTFYDKADFYANAESIEKYNVLTDVAEQNSGQTNIPENFNIRLWPNPVHSSVNVQLESTQAGKIEIELYNILGQRIARASYGPVAAGQHTFHWQPKMEMTAGVYFIKVRVDNHVYANRKICFLR